MSVQINANYPPPSVEQAGAANSTRMFDQDRWRSFAERYIVARAAKFEVGKEREELFTTTQDALMAYEHIYAVGRAHVGQLMPEASSVLGVGRQPVDDTTLLARVAKKLGVTL